MVIEFPSSLKLPPIDLTHKILPEEDILEIKISVFPFEDIPPPKEFEKLPVTNKLPNESQWIYCPTSLDVEPKEIAHIKLPLEDILEIKMSLLPADVKLWTPIPGSKSTVP